MRRLRQLEEENQRLKSLVAHPALDKEMLQDVIRRKMLRLPGSARWSIMRRRLGGVSMRRVCRARPVDRSTQPFER